MGSAILVGMSKRTQTEEEKWSKPRGLRLRDGESVVMVVRPSRALSLGKYLYTLGLYGIWRKRHVYVLTDTRLMIGKGVVNRTETSIPMNRVDEASFVRRGPVHIAKLSLWPTVGGGRNSWGRFWPRTPGALPARSRPGSDYCYRDRLAPALEGS